MKEFKRMTKMSCRFSLHCITTVTWENIILIFPNGSFLHYSWGGQYYKFPDRRSLRSHKPKAKRCWGRQRQLQRGSQAHSSPWTCSRRNSSFWNHREYETENPKLNPQPDSSADLLSLPLPGDLLRGEGSAVEVLGHVRVLPQKCLLHHRLVEPLQLLVHPREEEQGHLLQQDQDDYLKIMLVLSWFNCTHLEHHEDAGILQESLHIEGAYKTPVQSVKPWLKYLRRISISVTFYLTINPPGCDSQSLGQHRLPAFRHMVLRACPTRSEFQWQHCEGLSECRWQCRRGSQKLELRPGGLPCQWHQWPTAAIKEDNDISRFGWGWQWCKLQMNIEQFSSRKQAVYNWNQIFHSIHLVQLVLYGIIGVFEDSHPGRIGKQVFSSIF